MLRATGGSLQPLPGISNVLTDENSAAMRGDIPLNTIVYTEIRTTTIKVNTPDEYYGDRRKLKAFII